MKNGISSRSCLMAITAATAMAFWTGCGGQSGAPSMGTYGFTTFDGPAGAPTTVNGINNDGVVVGFTTQNGQNQNFLRSAAGAFTSLDVGDMAAGMANGVTGAGTVVGVANSAAFLLENGSITM